MDLHEYDVIIEKLTKLLEEWKVRSNVLYRFVKDELLVTTNVVNDKLRKKDFYDAFNEIRELGVQLEAVYTHMNELGPLYNKIWSLVEDKV